MRQIKRLTMVILLLALGVGACGPESPTPPPTVPPTLPENTPEAVSCQITVTRTPPPDAPTYGPDPSGRTGVVDPHVEMCASATTLQVGETLVIVGEAVDVGMADYTLSVQDRNVENATLLVAFDGAYQPVVTDSSQILDHVSSEMTWWQATFVLRASGPGTVEVRIDAGGEIHYGYPGPATWGHGISDTMTITVIEN